MKIRKTGS